MNKYIYQNGGEEDTSFYNQLADNFINSQQQASYSQEQPMQENDVELEDENGFITNLRQMEADDVQMDDARLLESFNEKLTVMQQQMDFKMEEMQNEMVAYAALSSDDGQDYFERMYDTADDEVPFSVDATFPKINNLYFNNAGKQGMNNIGQKGAEIGNTVAGMLGYKPTFNSIYRDAEQQKKYVNMGIGAPNSYHLTGDAVDMKPEDWNKLTKPQQNQLKSQYDVVYHNNHYHIEPK